MSERFFTGEEQAKLDALRALEFPRYCANNCGRVLLKREEGVRVKYTHALDGRSWFDWVCKKDCEPKRTYADANGFCPIGADDNG